MPVRVKQRSTVVNQRAEHHRLREALKKDTVGLLLGWQDPVLLKIRDGDNKSIINLNTSNALAAGHVRDPGPEIPRSAHLTTMLHIMTQAEYITIDDWPSWVLASASTTAMSIKGAISLQPLPTKHLQFITFGLRPLSNGDGHNELYDHVNRLFALSSFGTVEDDADVDELEKLRRQSDKRFKNEGYTNRQLKARKGVDKHPMYHLHISLKDRRFTNSVDDGFLEDESNLQALVNILSAMITQWLSVNHFCPRKSHQKSDLPRKAPTPASNLQNQSHRLSGKCEVSPSTSASSFAGTSLSKPMVAKTTKRQKIMGDSLETSVVKPRQRAFAEWSRIKSGRSNFFNSTGPMAKTATCLERPPSPFLRSTMSQLRLDESLQAYVEFNVAPILRGALRAPPAIANSSEPGRSSPPATEDTDGTVLWTDPSSQKTYLLNARTGCLVQARGSPAQTNSATPLLTAPKAGISKSIRMAPKPATAEPIKTPWLDGLLQSWENPVFKPSERGIQQMTLQCDVEHGGRQKLQHNPARCSDFDIQKAFHEAGSSSARLSKEDLRNAQVVSQVDKKFILVKMGGLSTRSESQPTAEILVLIDQHAADERIHVEKLLADLCAPANSDAHSGYQSKLGLGSPVAFVNLEKPLQFVVSSQECIYFRIYANRFAAWGVLYDISSSASHLSRSANTKKDTFKITVATLPPSISERCRVDPQLLISFLRSAVWKYVESPPLAPVASSDQCSNWVQKIATCPPGLVDMINSRACRSATMFNDELSLEECMVLVNKLAGCVFPFMCAHGRPSMVPIVDLGRVGFDAQDFDRQQGTTGTIEQGGFVGAWKSWKKT